MFLQYWGFREPPFHSRQSADWFYPSASHDESLARLFYLIEHVHPLGFLTGPTGVGKTHLLSLVARQSRRTQRQTVFIDALGLTESELLWEIACELRVSPAPDDTTDRLWRRIASELRGLKLGQIQTLLIFDHLDQADPECGAVIRRLLHTTRVVQGTESGIDDWLTIIASAETLGELTGSFELRRTSELHIELEAFSHPETVGYLRAKLDRIGFPKNPFEREAGEAIFAYSRGLPRRIDRLAHLSLVAAAGESLPHVTGELVLSVASDLEPSLNSR